MAFNSAVASSLFFLTQPGKVAEGRGKLAKLVEISLGQPEQPMFPANHLLAVHKRRISGSQVKGIRGS